MSRNLLAFALIFSLFVTCAVPARPEEGLWTFDNFPVQEVEDQYGIDVSKSLLSHIMNSAVRLSNGCSASLVSASGLVLTNNHCVSECAQEISSTQDDSFHDGFVAGQIAEEKKCAKLSAEVILSVADVTSQMAVSVSDRTAPSPAKAQADMARKIEKVACADDSTVRCQVTAFYSGAQYKLFKYRKYEDVRLAFSPGVTMSHLSDIDVVPCNLDVAFLRLYEKNAPLTTPEHLSWNSSAPRAGQLVFVAGNPRSSERDLTVSELRTERDKTVPDELWQDNELIRRLTSFGQQGAENKRASEYALADVTNHTEYMTELEKTLENDDLFTRKLSEESNLRDKGGPGIHAELSNIAQAEQSRRQLALPRQFLVSGPFFDSASSQLFIYARTLVRGALERAKPEAERQPGYAGSQLADKEEQLFQGPAIYQPLERMELEFWLDAAQQSLQQGDATLKLLLNGLTPAQLALNLSQSRLGDEAVRRQLWDGGLAAVKASTDPMIRFVLRIEPAAQAMQANWQHTVTGPEDRAAAEIARVRLKLFGSDVYPDANRTLRLSYGKIDGYQDGARRVGPFTTFRDLFREASAPNPPKIEPAWLRAQKSLPMDTVLDLFTTNDGINGNSGSPLINGRGEVIGAFYGGNNAALDGDYWYDPKLNRAVAVSAAAVTQALLHVYAAPNLAKELSGQTK